MSKQGKRGRKKSQAPGGPPGLNDSRIAELERRHVQLKSDVGTKVELEAAKHPNDPGNANPDSKTRAIVAGLENDIVARIEKIITQRVDWKQLKNTIDTQVRNAFRLQFGDIMNEIEKRVADTLSYGMAGGGAMAAALGDGGGGEARGSSGGGGSVDVRAFHAKFHDFSMRMDNLDSRVSDFAGDLSTMNNSLNGATGLRGQIHEVQREQYVLEHQKLAAFLEHIAKVEESIKDTQEKIPGIVKTCFETENKRFEVQLIARIKQQFDGKIDALRQRLVDTEKRTKQMEGEMKKQAKLTSDMKAQVDKNRDAKVEFETKSSNLQHELAGLRTQHHSIDTKMDRMKKKMDELPEMNALVDQMYSFEQRLKVMDNSMNQKFREQSTRVHQTIKEEIMASNAKIMAATKQMAHSVATDASSDAVSEWGSGSSKQSAAVARRTSKANFSLPNQLAQMQNTVAAVDTASMRQVESKIEDILGQISDLHETVDEMREDNYSSSSSLQREDLAKYLAPVKGQLIEIEQAVDKTKDQVAELANSIKGQGDAMNLLRSQMTDFVMESCRSMKSEIEDGPGSGGGMDEAQLEFERAEVQRRLGELEASFMTKHHATTDELTKLKQNIKWDKEAAVKRVNEVHEMASMQGKSNQRTAAAVDTTISQVDMLLRKMAHVDLLKRSVDGQMQELQYVKKDLNKFEVKVEDTVAASEALAAELRRRIETARQSKAEEAMRANRQRAATDSGFEIAGPLPGNTLTGSRSMHHLPQVQMHGMMVRNNTTGL